MTGTGLLVAGGVLVGLFTMAATISKLWKCGSSP